MMSIERMMSALTYFIALFLAWLGDFSLQDLGTVLAMVLGVAAFALSWYYRRKTYQLLAAGAISREEYERANR
ncbi:HP1 family phage holin [Enterobacter roggenkampii]|nr:MULTISPECIES: HP1 family phage holin [Enterobacteriaceae]MCQ4970020.1 phage holin family protein [Enterobacteriaceae bacterium DFI.7.85]MDW4578403.1 HP1 family phage holin [Atlantibacter hermannii]